MGKQRSHQAAYRELLQKYFEIAEEGFVDDKKDLDQIMDLLRSDQLGCSQEEARTLVGILRRGHLSPVDSGEEARDWAQLKPLHENGGKLGGSSWKTRKALLLEAEVPALRCQAEIVEQVLICVLALGALVIATVGVRAIASLVTTHPWIAITRKRALAYAAMGIGSMVGPYRASKGLRKRIDQRREQANAECRKKGWQLANNPPTERFKETTDLANALLPGASEEEKQRWKSTIEPAC